MKKEYVAPTVYAESFMLAEHISGSCSVSGRANHMSITDCGFDNGDPNGMIFLDDSGRCNYDPFGGDVTTKEQLDDLTNECKYSGFSDYAVMYSS